jgi:ribosomal-protein-alanine N-acetyltransferase
LKETNEVEVLYALAKLHWGKGIATKAARASVRFGFQVAQLQTIIALAFPENVASRRVMEHLGMAYVKGAHYFGIDLAYYALARESLPIGGRSYRLRPAALPVRDGTITDL